ncbi:GNAT family N-acetyltransferase [Rhodobacterales bacterium HKCCE3408]|nr:GNAT family N-acetyltransferase [Rhodobacterales bacterium HKCCE3408]
MRYAFRPVSAADAGLLARWHDAPHVRRWWDDPADHTSEAADPRVRRWIVSLDARPFAYIQDYVVHDWDDHPFVFLPEGTRGIDQFIGEAEMLGQRHGQGFIGIHTARLLAEGAPLVVTDPDPTNTVAVAVYTKLGFRPVGAPLETRWGQVQPMIRGPD